MRSFVAWRSAGCWGAGCFGGAGCCETANGAANNAQRMSAAARVCIPSYYARVHAPHQHRSQRAPGPHPRCELCRGHRGRPESPPDVSAGVRTVGDHAGDVELDAERPSGLDRGLARGRRRCPGVVTPAARALGFPPKPAAKGAPMPRRSGILLIRSVIAASATLPALGREGFGFTKRAVNMLRTRPPALNLAGARLRVKAASVRSDEGSDAESLQKMAEDAITAGDPRIAPSSAPDLDVRLS